MSKLTEAIHGGVTAVTCAFIAFLSGAGAFAVLSLTGTYSPDAVLVSVGTAAFVGIYLFVIALKALRYEYDGAGE